MRKIVPIESDGFYILYTIRDVQSTNHDLESTHQAHFLNKHYTTAESCVIFSKPIFWNMSWGEYTTLKSAGIPAHTHKRDLCKNRYICWCVYKDTVIITSKTLPAGRWKAFKVPSTLQT